MIYCKRNSPFPSVSHSVFLFTLILQISCKPAVSVRLCRRFQRTASTQPDPQMDETLMVQDSLPSDPCSQFQVPRRESDWLHSANGVRLLGQLSPLGQSAVARWRGAGHVLWNMAAEGPPTEKGHRVYSAGTLLDVPVPSLEHLSLGVRPHHFEASFYGFRNQPPHPLRESAPPPQSPRDMQ